MSGYFRLWVVSVMWLMSVVWALMSPSHAGPLAERWMQHRQERQNQDQDQDQHDDKDTPVSASLSNSGFQVWREVAYGPDVRQRLDVYLPSSFSSSTALHGIIFMVHGGGWKHGDKAHGRVIENKVQRWVPLGFAVVSINYRMLPDADVHTQVEDVRLALLHTQRLALTHGIAPDRLVLMGHSAGAHLVSLVAGDPATALALGIRPWLGVVSLDSAAMDVPALMKDRHLPLYDAAFGQNPSTWRALSPKHQLHTGAAPSLLVCSTKRRSQPCTHAQSYADHAHQLGNRSEVLPQALSHSDINQQLGLPTAYTKAVEQFLATLHPSWGAVFRQN